jgi:RNA polymerase sigma-70 factor (ECF subfamily)
VIETQVAGHDKHDVLTLESADGPEVGLFVEGPAHGPSYALTAADEARYRAMVGQYFDAVWRTLRGLGVAAICVDDAAQQVFLVALRRLDAISPGSERSFLLGTAVGIASNVRRSAARAKEIADPDAVGARIDPRPDPEEALVIAERRALVERVLDQMPDELRTVFVLFELEGLTSAEIAQTLGIPAGTVSSRLRRSRERFEATLHRTRRTEERDPR